jgi:hypothetical protein
MRGELLLYERKDCPFNRPVKYLATGNRIIKVIYRELFLPSTLGKATLHTTFEVRSKTVWLGVP